MNASSVSRRGLALATCTAALLCAGCDKPPPTVEVYVPPALGTTWTLKRESTGSFGSGTTFVTVERGERTWNGQPVIAYDSVASTTLVTAKGETIAVTIGDTPLFTLDPPLGLPWPLRVGRAQTSAHRVIQHWNDQTLPFEVSVHVEADEEVTVPAGTFRTFRIRITDTRGQEEMRWFSPERGITVRQRLKRDDKWPSGPGTQETELVPARTDRTPRVGFLWGGFVGGTEFPHALFQRTLAQGLHERGWVNGQNVLFVHRYNRDVDPAQEQRNVDDLIRLKMDVIVDTWGFGPAQATKTIPIVTLFAVDPVRLGLAQSYARPGGNVTGMAGDFDPPIDARSFELLCESVPQARRIAVLYWQPLPGEPTGVVLEHINAVATRRKIQLHALEVGTWAEVERAIERARSAGAQAVWVPGELLLIRRSQELARLALKSGLPLGGSSAAFAVGGAVVGSGTEPEYNYRGAATYIDRILRGAKPGDLPFEQSARTRTVVNLKTARALGLTLPKALIARADQVIE